MGSPRRGNVVSFLYCLVRVKMMVLVVMYIYTNLSFLTRMSRGRKISESGDGSPSHFVSQVVFLTFKLQSNKVPPCRG